MTYNKSKAVKTLDEMRKDHLAPEVSINNIVSMVVDETASMLKHQLQASVRTCMNCEHFSATTPAINKGDMCTKFNARPPAYVIVAGCDKHEWNDEIPF